MTISYCVEVIGWILNQPHRVKDMTVCYQMKTQSAKAKGRRLQQWVRNLLIEELEIHPEDIESRSMGAGGEDLIMGSCCERKVSLLNRM